MGIKEKQEIEYVDRLLHRYEGIRMPDLEELTLTKALTLYKRWLIIAARERDSLQDIKMALLEAEMGGYCE